MDCGKSNASQLAQFLHKYFLSLLLVAYVAAALWPGPGLWLRHCSLGTIHLGTERVPARLPVVMLALLLFNAGLGVRTSRLRFLFQRPWALFAGLAINIALPITFILAMTWWMRGWHSPDEVQSILVGLALVASMPIAGSSTAWSQNADGDMTLSLGLVVASTLLSPLLTPLTFHALEWVAMGRFAAELHRLASGGTQAFMMVAVIVPSLLGIGMGAGIGEARMAAAKPYLKVFNSMILLVLNYANAAISLLRMIAQPDADFFALIFLMVTTLCVLAFAAGWGTGRLVGDGRDQRVSLMFAVGMNNNGTALVLASMLLSKHPRVMLPIIVYNMVQHLVAGAANVLVDRASAPTAASPAALAIEVAPARGKTFRTVPQLR